MAEHKLMLMCPVHGLTEHVIPFPDLNEAQSVHCTKCTEDWLEHHGAGKTEEFVRHCYLLTPEKNLMNRPLADEEPCEYMVKFEEGEAVMAVKGQPCDVRLLGGTWVKTTATTLQAALERAHQRVMGEEMLKKDG